MLIGLANRLIPMTLVHGLVHLRHHVVTMLHHLGMILVLSLLVLALLLRVLGRAMLRVADHGRSSLCRCKCDGGNKDIHGSLQFRVEIQLV
jgi:hypothetical protein